MMHGCECDMMNPRFKMSHESAARVQHFQLRVIIFQCRTNDRASYSMFCRLRQTVHTSVHQAAKLVAAVLRVSRVTAGLA